MFDFDSQKGLQRTTFFSIEQTVPSVSSQYKSNLHEPFQSNTMAGRKKAAAKSPPAKSKPAAKTATPIVKRGRGRPAGVKKTEEKPPTPPAAAAAKSPGRRKKTDKVAETPKTAVKPTPVRPPVSPMMLPPIPMVGGVPIFNDDDILLPTTNEAIASRPANREYITILQANCMIYHSMPSPEQMWFLNNLVHFCSTVRNRKFVHVMPMGGYRVWRLPNIVGGGGNASGGSAPQPEPPILPFLVAELNLDPFKRSAFFYHPFWLLGEHDTLGGIKSSDPSLCPFVHRKLDGKWKRVKNGQDDLRAIIKAEGCKNLLLLPGGMDFTDPEEEEPNAKKKGGKKGTKKNKNVSV